MSIADYFARDYHGAPFRLFDGAHLGALLCVLLLNLLLLGFSNRLEEVRCRLRWTMAIILWANEVGWHLWNESWGLWTIQTMLPLKLVSWERFYE